MAFLAPLLKQRFFDSNNLPLNGGKVFTYIAGTTTPRATFTDSTESSQNTNPIILDAEGQCDIWLGTSSYKFVVTDANDVILETIDNVSLPSGAAAALPTGGTANQLLRKNSATNYDASFVGPLAAAAFGSTPNANGITVDPAALTIGLQPADSTNPGALSAAAQTIGGAKTFAGNIIASALIRGNHTVDNATTGIGASFAATTLIHVLTNVSLSSINNISSPANSQILILLNSTGVNITITNNAGGTAENRIKTGSTGDLTFSNGAALWLAYDPNASRWQVIGGSGSGSSTPTLFGSSGSPRSVATTGITSAASHMSTTDADQVIFLQGNAAGENIISTITAGTIIGQRMTLIGRNNSNFITIFNGTTTNTELVNGEWFSYLGRTLVLMWDGTAWVEIGRS